MASSEVVHNLKKKYVILVLKGLIKHGKNVRTKLALA